MAKRWCVIAVIITGCGGDESAGPTSEDLALAADGLASIDAEAAVLDAIELLLSGDFVFAPLSADELPSDTLDRTIQAATTFAAARLSPMTCIASSGPVDQVVTHELAGCTVGGHEISGTVVSTWSLIDTVQVDHESVDLAIDGRAIRLLASVEGFLAGAVETRRRALTLEAGGIVLDGTWLATLDTATGCGTKAGTSQAALDGGVLRRTDVGLAWCGEGIADTITGGEVRLVRGAAAVNLVFLGDDQVVLDGPSYTLESTVSELRDL